VAQRKILEPVPKKLAVQVGDEPLLEMIDVGVVHSLGQIAVVGEWRQSQVVSHVSARGRY
jgi:hypothetical protein